MLAAEIADRPEQAVGRRAVGAVLVAVGRRRRSCGAYLSVAGDAVFVPAEPRTTSSSLLDVMLLEKALYELRYELNNRPDWVRIPARGITQLWTSGTDPQGSHEPHRVAREELMPKTRTPTSETSREQATAFST